MDELPLCVVRDYLFKYLNLKEIINCALIFKNCKMTYDEFYRPNKLCLYYEHYPFYKCYTYTNEPIDFKNSIKIKRLNFLQHEITKSYLQNIKKLIIFKFFDYRGTDKFQFSFESFVNHFKMLEHVEIKDSDLHIQDTELNLQNLKILMIQFSSISIDKITLNTPSLDVLIVILILSNSDTNLLSKFNFSFPDSLRYLEFRLGKIGSLDSRENLEFKNEFKNLECLTYHNKIESPDQLSSDLLANFPSLKLLILNANDILISELNQVKFNYNLDELLILKNYWNLDDFYPVWRANEQQLNQFKYSPIKFFFLHINQEFLNRFNSYKIEDVTFKKYFKISDLFINQGVDNLHLLNFLRTTGHLHYLSINCGLVQSFFDQITDCITIESLILAELSISNITDYTFLSKLKLFQMVFLCPLKLLTYKLIYNLSKNKYFKYFNGADINVINNKINNIIDRLIKKGHTIQMNEDCNLICSNCFEEKEDVQLTSITNLIDHLKKDSQFNLIKNFFYKLVRN